jgi:hypothetical protein
MNLRVVHLLRKVERIDRDIEELDALMGTLQMDREYSARLRDSLVEESFRLRQLKQRINSQVIRIPPHFEAMLADGRRPEMAVRPDVAVRSEPARADATDRSEPAKIQASSSDRSAHKEASSSVLPTQEPITTQAATPTSENGSANGSAASKDVEKTEPATVRNPGTAADKKKPPFLFRFE